MIVPPLSDPVEGYTLCNRGSSTYLNVADEEPVKTPGARAVRTEASSALGQAGVTHTLLFGPAHRNMPALPVAAVAKWQKRSIPCSAPLMVSRVPPRKGPHSGEMSPCRALTNVNDPDE